MKRKGSLTVNIPHPCTKSWNEMTPAEGGRFCLHCQKNVTDFSSMTDKEVLAVISKHQGSLCGNFQPEQLNRALTTDRQPRHAFLPAAMLASLIATIVPVNSEAHEPGAAITQIETFSSDDRLTANTPLLLKGQIVDSLTNEGLAGVTITLKGSNGVGAVTDAAGKFQLTIPSGAAAGLLTLKISYLGYNTKEISFNTERLSAPVTISLQQSVTDLQELVVTGYATRKVRATTMGVVVITEKVIVNGSDLDRLTWWERIAHLFKKKEKYTE